MADMNTMKRGQFSFAFNDERFADVNLRLVSPLLPQSVLLNRKFQHINCFGGDDKKSKDTMPVSSYDFTVLSSVFVCFVCRICLFFCCLFVCLFVCLFCLSYLFVCLFFVLFSFFLVCFLFCFLVSFYELFASYFGLWVIFMFISL